MNSTENQMRFKDKVVIITGSSSGIGCQTLLMMAKEGAFVTMHGVTQAHIDETLQIFRDAGIPENRIHCVQGSLENEEVVKKLVNETVEKFGRLDVVVCNAAVSYIQGDPDFFTIKCLRHVLEINLVSAINLVQLSIPHLTKTRGNVILISSVLSYRTSFIGQFYGVSKAALNQYARIAAMMYGPLGIRVNSIIVGVTKTRMYERVQKPELTDSFIDETVKISALKRWAEPSEIGEFIMFVASEKAQFITGAVLEIDGGLCSNAMPAPANILDQLSKLEPQSHGISL